MLTFCRAIKLSLTWLLFVGGLDHKQHAAAASVNNAKLPTANKEKSYTTRRFNFISLWQTYEK